MLSILGFSCFGTYSFHATVQSVPDRHTPKRLADEKGSDTVTSALAVYRHAVRVSNEIVDQCDDLDRLCERALTCPRALYLRHGHTDRLRNALDH
jgi:hypothetical protein